MKFKAQAVQGLTNTFSILIAIDDDCEKLQYKYSNEEKSKEAEIEYELTDGDEVSRAYFETDHGVVFYLEDFMRI